MSVRIVWLGGSGLNQNLAVAGDAIGVPEFFYQPGLFWLGQVEPSVIYQQVSPDRIIATIDHGNAITTTRINGSDLSIANGKLAGGTIRSIDFELRNALIGTWSSIDSPATDLVEALDSEREMQRFLASGLGPSNKMNINAQAATPNVEADLFGWEGPFVFIGSSGDDNVVDGLNDDQVFGGDGDDTIRSSAGEDSLRGENGNDWFFIEERDRGLAERDIVNGGPGEDWVSYAGSGGSVVVDLSDELNNAGFATGDLLRELENVRGTVGNDRLVGDDADNVLDGIRGQDTLIGNDGDDHLTLQVSNNAILRGGPGNDRLSVVTSDGVTFDGGPGWDVVDFGFPGANTGVKVDMANASNGVGVEGAVFLSVEVLHGTEFQDTLLGDEGANRLFGMDGADSIEGRSGNDILRGGIDGDVLRGGAQQDRLFGEAGDDTLYGDAGFDLLDGLAGRDELHGGAQADNLFGGLGDDTLYGDGGLDRLFGGAGFDLLFGGAGRDGLFGDANDDQLNGGDEADRLFGGQGDDTLFGGAGDDSLFGNAGFDTLVGGEGNDQVSGNFNADLFVFDTSGVGFGIDTITDFDVLNRFEKIDLSAVGSIVNFADLVANHLSQAGSDAVIDAGSGQQIVLAGVNVVDLDGTDFVF